MLLLPFMLMLLRLLLFMLYFDVTFAVVAAALLRVAAGAIEAFIYVSDVF